MKITRTGAVIALSTALLMPICTFPTQASVVYTETEGIPSMENPVRPDKNGVLKLENDALLDFIIPDVIDGITVDAIGAYAFEGCDLIRTVSIPASVTEIGEGAFSDCPYLQAIILKDRSDLQDMLLGANWSGDAQVICEFTRTLSTEPAPDYSQPALEDKTDTGTETSDPDASLPDNIPSDLSQLVTKANDTSESSVNHIDVTETTDSPEPSMDSAGELSQNIPSEAITE